MKNDKRLKAERLYFDTNMSKTQIAHVLGVSRRTIIVWCQQGNWERLRMSAQHLPSIVAEKCYYLLDKYTSMLLRESTPLATLDHRHANTINMLATCIKKLKNRHTVNESMEMFNFFLEQLRKKDPVLATTLQPHVEDYIYDRTIVNANDFLLHGFNDDATLPYPEAEMPERYLDDEDIKAFHEELKRTGDHATTLHNWQQARSVA